MYNLWPAVNWVWYRRPNLGVGIPDQFVAGGLYLVVSREACRPTCYEVRLHENSCRYLGRPPLGGELLLPERPRPGVCAGQKKNQYRAFILGLSVNDLGSIWTGTGRCSFFLGLFLCVFLGFVLKFFSRAGLVIAFLYWQCCGRKKKEHWRPNPWNPFCSP